MSGPPLPSHRRARPLLGTLVEIGVLDADAARAHATIAAAFASIAAVEAELSRFRADSDIGRFAALPAGGSVSVGRHTAQVLAAAAALRDETAGLFDVSVGSGPLGWRCDGSTLHKIDGGTRLDLGGIGKGHAVDCGIAALQEHTGTGGWVNAGGDLRTFGAVELAIELRDEQAGGTRPLLRLADGALATSHYGAGSRALLVAPGRAAGRSAHFSVAAPSCLWADALTKVVALSGDCRHPALRSRDARAWRH